MWKAKKSPCFQTVQLRKDLSFHSNIACWKRHIIHIWQTIVLNFFSYTSDNKRFYCSKSNEKIKWVHSSKRMISVETLLHFHFFPLRMYYERWKMIRIIISHGRKFWKKHSIKKIFSAKLCSGETYNKTPASKLFFFLFFLWSSQRAFLLPGVLSLRRVVLKTFVALITAGWSYLYQIFQGSNDRLKIHYLKILKLKDKENFNQTANKIQQTGSHPSRRQP